MITEEELRAKIDKYGDLLGMGFNDTELKNKIDLLEWVLTGNDRWLKMNKKEDKSGGKKDGN